MVNAIFSNVTIDYKINEGTNAYLAITSVENPNSTYNYIVDLEEDNIQLDMSTLSPGVYVVSMIVNGQLQDTKNLIKN